MIRRCASAAACPGCFRRPRSSRAVGCQLCASHRGDKRIVCGVHITGLLLTGAAIPRSRNLFVGGRLAPGPIGERDRRFSRSRMQRIWFYQIPPMDFCASNSHGAMLGNNGKQRARAALQPRRAFVQCSLNCFQPPSIYEDEAQANIQVTFIY